MLAENHDQQSLQFLGVLISQSQRMLTLVKPVANANHVYSGLPVISLLFWPGWQDNGSLIRSILKASLALPDASTAEKICTSKFKSSPG